MSRLIAQVATAVLVDGVRTVIAAGQPLPDELNEHDQRELESNKLATREGAEARAAAKEKAAEAKGRAAFEAERQAAQAAQQSTQPPESEGGAGEGEGADEKAAQPTAKPTPLQRRTKAG